MDQAKMDQAKPESPHARTWGEFAGEVAKNPWVEGAVGLATLAAVIATRGKLLSAAEKYLPEGLSVTEGNGQRVVSTLGKDFEGASGKSLPNELGAIRRSATYQHGGLHDAHAGAIGSHIITWEDRVTGLTLASKPDQNVVGDILNAKRP
jgi:hypothetical protein